MFEIQFFKKKFAGCLQILLIPCLNGQLGLVIWKLIREGIIISLIQNFEADFL